MSDLISAIDHLVEFVREHHGRSLDPEGDEDKLLMRLDAEVYAQCKSAGLEIPKAVFTEYWICSPLGHCGVPRFVAGGRINYCLETSSCFGSAQR